MSKIFNFILEVWDRFKGDPQIKLGYRLIIASLFVAGGLSIAFVSEKFSVIYEDNTGLGAWVFASIVLVLGIVLIVLRLIELRSKPPYLLYGVGLANMDPRPPRYALNAKDRAARDLRYNLESYDRSKVIETYRVMKYNFLNRVEHSNASQLYVAALGSFPFQFLVGALIRNAHVKTTLLEYDRNESKWHSLKSFCEEEPIMHIVNGVPLDIQAQTQHILASSPQEIGIALAYTFPIPMSQIPPALRQSTLILNHSYGHGHDKLECKDNQKRLLDDLSLLLRSLGEDNRKIHLFVSAQSSICIAMGKNYMDNAHGTLVLHNYDNSLQDYTWSIEFNGGEIL